jgi:hypothetical protein
MSRLIDDLRAPGARVAMPFFVRHDKQDAWQLLGARVHDLLMNPELPVLLIDNVAEYYYAADQEYWDLREDFPNLAPPYPVLWCEHKMVKRIQSKECGDTDLSALVPHGRTGMLIHGLNPAETHGEGIPANARWLLWCELFIDFGRRGVTADGPDGSVFCASIPTAQSSTCPKCSHSPTQAMPTS